MLPGIPHNVFSPSCSAASYFWACSVLPGHKFFSCRLWMPLRQFSPYGVSGTRLPWKCREFLRRLLQGMRRSTSMKWMSDGAQSALFCDEICRSPRPLRGAFSGGIASGVTIRRSPAYEAFLLVRYPITDIPGTCRGGDYKWRRLSVSPVSTHPIREIWNPAERGVGVRHYAGCEEMRPVWRSTGANGITEGLHTQNGSPAAVRHMASETSTITGWGLG